MNSLGNTLFKIPSSLQMFKRFDRYGDRLNCYDLLKVIALLTMVVDHLGFYIWVDALWMRAIGRMAFPLFLFLVGYSGSWKIRFDLCFYAVFLVILCALLHFSVFPMNILATIICTRMIMQPITRMALTNEMLAGIFIFCTVFMIPTMQICDYGTLAILFALCGHLQRTRPSSSTTVVMIECTTLLSCLLEFGTFKFQEILADVVIAVAMVNLFLMSRFELTDIDNRQLPVVARRLLQWISRNTLPIYALHIAALMLIERIWIFPKNFWHFHWF